MSVSVGAFDAVAPVAAHMPGGGDASSSLIPAERILLEVEALVEVLRRVDVAVGSRIPSGCGKGTGVATLLLGSDLEVGVAMFTGLMLQRRLRRVL